MDKEEMGCKYEAEIKMLMANQSELMKDQSGIVSDQKVIMADQKKLLTCIYGNGRKGLVDIIPELSTDLKNLTKTLEDHSKQIGDLIKTTSESTGETRGAEKARTSSRQSLAIIISVISFVGGMALAFLFKFIEHLAQ